MADLISNSKSYQDLLARLKNQIRTAQVRAAVAVNQELVLLYWGIGKEILTRQKEDGWGTRVIERLAKDLRSEFPDMQRACRPRNLGYMKALAEAWPEEPILQQAVAKLPWGHNVRLLDLVKNHEERIWYLQSNCMARAPILSEPGRWSYIRRPYILKLYWRRFRASIGMPQTWVTSCVTR